MCSKCNLSAQMIAQKSRPGAVATPPLLAPQWITGTLRRQEIALSAITVSKHGIGRKASLHTPTMSCVGLSHARVDCSRPSTSRPSNVATSFRLAIMPMRAHKGPKTCLSLRRPKSCGKVMRTTLRAAGKSVCIQGKTHLIPHLTLRLPLGHPGSAPPGLASSGQTVWRPATLRMGSPPMVIMSNAKSRQNRAAHFMSLSLPQSHAVTICKSAIMHIAGPMAHLA
jgi:hypothetical protein